MSTIGQILTAARDRAGYTIAELSARTCIRDIVLNGMEHDDFGPCGGDFYARGHIKAVCRELGVDPTELVARYDAEYSSGAASPLGEGGRPARPVRGGARANADPPRRPDGADGADGAQESGDGRPQRRGLFAPLRSAMAEAVGAFTAETAEAPDARQDRRSAPGDRRPDAGYPEYPVEAPRQEQRPDPALPAEGRAGEPGPEPAPYLHGYREEGAGPEAPYPAEGYRGEPCPQVEPYPEEHRPEQAWPEPGRPVQEYPEEDGYGRQAARPVPFGEAPGPAARPEEAAAFAEPQERTGAAEPRFGAEAGRAEWAARPEEAAPQAAPAEPYGAAPEAAAEFWPAPGHGAGGPVPDSAEHPGPAAAEEAADRPAPLPDTEPWDPFPGVASENGMQEPAADAAEEYGEASLRGAPQLPGPDAGREDADEGRDRPPINLETAGLGAFRSRRRSAGGILGEGVARPEPEHREVPAAEHAVPERPEADPPPAEGPEPDLPAAEHPAAEEQVAAAGALPADGFGRRGSVPVDQPAPDEYGQPVAGGAAGCREPYRDARRPHPEGPGMPERPVPQQAPAGGADRLGAAAGGNRAGRPGRAGSTGRPIEPGLAIHEVLGLPAPESGGSGTGGFRRSGSSARRPAAAEPPAAQVPAPRDARGAEQARTGAAPAALRAASPWSGLGLAGDGTVLTAAAGDWEYAAPFPPGQGRPEEDGAPIDGRGELGASTERPGWLRRNWPLGVAACLVAAAVIAGIRAWPEGGIQEVREAGIEQDAGERAEEAAGEGAADRAEGAGRGAAEEGGAGAAGTAAKEHAALREQEPQQATDTTQARQRAEEVRVELHATERTWVEVTDARGAVVYTGTVPQGASREWADDDELNLHLGDPSSVRVAVNGEERQNGRLTRLTFRADELAP